MPSYHVPKLPDDWDDEIEFGGMRIVVNDNVPNGMVEIHDERGLQSRFDWRRDFERWQREQQA